MEFIENMNIYHQCSLAFSYVSLIFPSLMEREIDSLHIRRRLCYQRIIVKSIFISSILSITKKWIDFARMSISRIRNDFFPHSLILFYFFLFIFFLYKPEGIGVRFTMRSLDFFNWPNPSSSTIYLGSTQTVTEMSTRNFPGDKGWKEREAHNLPPSVSRLSRQNVEASTSHNLMGLHGLLKEYLYLFPSFIFFCAQIVMQALFSVVSPTVSLVKNL
jgi:hypothetical protein